MTSSWPLVRLGDFLHVKHGFAFRGEHFGDKGDYIVLTPGNFFDEGGFKPKSGAEKYYTAQPLGEYVLGRDDLVIAMTEQVQGLLGSSALIPREGVYLHNQRIGLVELSPGVDRRFVYYLFNTSIVRDQIQATASGSKVRHTAPARVESVQVRLPQLDTQRKVAAILSAYDNLIDNNMRRIEILEEMAQRIYREWFVELRYPGQTAEILKAKAGDVPKGWRVAQMREIATISRGQSYRSTDIAAHGGVPFVSLKCISRDGGFRAVGIKAFVGRYDPQRTVRTGDVVVAVTDMTQERRIVARAARIPRLGTDLAVMSMDLVKITPTSDVPVEYMYGTLRYSAFPDQVKQFANGANVLHLHPDRIGDYPVVVPPQALMHEYATHARPLFEQCDVLNSGVRTLQRTRDLLLPRLIAGEINVEDLDIEVEASAA